MAHAKEAAATCKPCKQQLVFLQGVAGLPSQDLTPSRGLPAASLSGRELQRPSPSHLRQDMCRIWKGLASWENLGKDVGKITRFSVVEEHDNLNQLMQGHASHGFRHNKIWE
ncbi:hypothetical protein ACQJBY_027500 [Aegilops geniculata]